MTKLRRKTAAVLSTAVLGAGAGCSSAHATVPAEFCKVSVEKDSLAPLIPNGSSIKQKYTAAEAQPGASCTLRVDGHQVLFVDIVRWDRAPDPVDWNKVGSPYKHAAQRPVSFPGYASIGSDHAIIQAKCNTHTAYMSFAVYFSGDRVEDTPLGYKKLLRFINDFVPRETDKFGCTKN
ncbi:hypothetical protein [Streptomyces mirabilis]|uniref:hypothetical protein n=1 Tax=Streptomyces mirabilis TaxID=68239 RepID=UPI003246B0ED